MSSPLGLLVIGAGPAALAAARGYRTAGGQGPVGLVSDEGRMPYRRPPLTKELLRGELDEVDLPIEADDWFGVHDVHLITAHAERLDPGAHTVTLSGGRGLTYGTAVLATGAEPRRLPVRGADHPAVHVIRTLAHVRGLLARIGDGDPVAVIGSGFIGCEIAASLARRGHPVTLVSDEAQPNAERLGPEAGAEIAGWLRAEGVAVVLGTPLEEIAAGQAGLELRSQAAPIVAPTVVMAAGASPRGELAAAAGLALAPDGAVPTDAGMRTTAADLLAAGDVTRAENATAGRALRVEHWGDALGQGAVAGRVAAGEDAFWGEVPGFWSTIGDHVLKYAAWGDGFDASRVERHGADGAFTVWYGRQGRLAGVLSHGADGDYVRGRALIARGEEWSG